jgi:hypothetical protein
VVLDPVTPFGKAIAAVCFNLHKQTQQRMDFVVCRRILSTLYAIGRPLPFPEALPWKPSLPLHFKDPEDLSAKLLAWKVSSIGTNIQAWYSTQICYSITRAAPLIIMSVHDVAVIVVYHIRRRRLESVVYGVDELGQPTLELKRERCVVKRWQRPRYDSFTQTSWN